MLWPRLIKQTTTFQAARTPSTTYKRRIRRSHRGSRMHVRSENSLASQLMRSLQYVQTASVCIDGFSMYRWLLYAQMASVCIDGFSMYIWLQYVQMALEFIHSFILVISIAPFKSTTTQRRSRLQHGHCIGVSRRSAQATVGKGLAQGPYMTARAGIEPTTLRLKAIDSTKAPPCPTILSHRMYR